LKAEITDQSAYLERTGKSKLIYERAKKTEPGGVSYKIRHFDPYPFFVKESKGSKLIDLDGNEYTDYWCTHMAMILGHGNPHVLEAIEKQAEKGWHPGVEHELTVLHAETLRKHIPSAEMTRYASSGSEASFFAVRLARTFTKRSKIAKFEGGWHGPYDPIHIALRPPYLTPPFGGITEGSQQDTIVVPFNDLAGFLDKVQGEELACVIMEPVLAGGGIIPAEIEFLNGVRKYCTDSGALLVFDEVVTGFRLGLGGAQSHFGVEPDITVLGKIIGGGLPIGAICGRQKVMEHLDHTRFSGLDYCHHGGTFAGNAISLAAGLATIEVLERPGVYEHIDKLGQQAREGLNAVFENRSFPAQAIGLGSLFAIHTTGKKPIKDVNSFLLCDHELSKSIFHHLLDNGIFMLTPETLHGAISYSHTEEDIDRLVSAMKPYVKENK
jgi:glutamate-1-semialdehyde 2,1-aminomutase